MPGRHGPGITDLVLPDVMGSLLEFPATPDHTRQRIYLSGDTLVYEDLHDIPKRYPDIDLGVFHLGGARVMGVMVTVDAEQGVEAVRIIDPKAAIPVHFDDYDLFTSGLDEFLAAASAQQGSATASTSCSVASPVRSAPSPTESGAGAGAERAGRTTP
jgi:L-ascorbate metabolism protein UlaG (beta-lactamase superfamily)